MIEGYIFALFYSHYFIVNFLHIVKISYVWVPFYQIAAYTKTRPVSWNVFKSAKRVYF